MRCEEIKIPFDNLGDAPLIWFLSEGDDPTDGFDYLFLIINDIVNKYNLFSRKLCLAAKEYAYQEAKDGNRGIHPKFLPRGSTAAASVSAVSSLSSLVLTNIVESCWNAGAQKYDIERLAVALQRELCCYTELPSIMSPMDFLRERFRFRDDSSPGLGGLETDEPIFESSKGVFFVQIQDLHLFEDVNQSLLSLGLTEGDTSLGGILSDQFHSLSYELLRSMLDGFRSPFELLSTEQVDQDRSTFGTALLQAMQEREGSDVGLMLETIGFPELRKSQASLLLSLKASGMVEIVHFLGFQLASEAHLFCELPVCMTNPLTLSQEETIVSSIKALSDEPGCVAEFLDDFVNDVLSFYETLIRNDAMTSNKTLRAFLLENNLCDDSDPVFAVLPQDLRTRNYVPLRQFLHQLKLSLLSRERTAGDRSADPEDAGESLAGFEAFASPSRGRCWLWEADERVDDAVDTKQPRNFEETVDHSLWFERTLPASQESSNVDLTSDEQVLKESEPVSMEQKEVPDDTADSFEHVEAAEAVDMEESDEPQAQYSSDITSAAETIQMWWRKHAPLQPMELDDFEAEWENMMSAAYNDSSPPETNDEEQYCYIDNEGLLRRWIDEHRLPQTVADSLIELGARNLDDVVLLVESYSQLLEGLLPLDRMKLVRAVQELKDNEAG